MVTRTSRRIAIAAIAAGAAMVAGVALVERRSDGGVEQAAPAIGKSAFVRAPGVPPRSRQDPAQRGTSPPLFGEVSATAPARPVAAAPRLRLQVHAPSDVRVGELFEVRVDVDAGGAVRELRFALSYDKSRLVLAEWSVGDFVVRGGVASAELHSDEPSEGSIEMNLNAGNDQWLAGAGNIALLRFEAREAGTAPIALRDVTSIDPSGAVSASDLRSGSITIH